MRDEEETKEQELARIKAEIRSRKDMIMRECIGVSLKDWEDYAYGK